ncbi:FMN-binding negative transcriptional regulator [Buchananella felis]|uniref:FMN-binding negative transcriptional regulator n=1 Tax=Buchananella felis TaxID=3231492 RepID=UPI00352728A7
MYVPAHFVLPPDHVEAILSDVVFGNLVTTHADGPQATPLPFYRDRERGVLVSHLVRNNPQATTPITGPGLLLVERGDSYVSPTWYATNAAMPNVPTWDYITLQVRGAVTVDLSPEAALEAARRLTAFYEPDSVLDAVGQAKLERMARAIAAVEISLDEVVGKAKMSQNRHPDDVLSVIAKFEELGLSEMARFLREVSLPYARERFAKIKQLRDVRLAAPLSGGCPASALDYGGQ